MVRRRRQDSFTSAHGALSMKTVDTHCHLWKEEISRRTWLDPEWEPWYRTFDAADLESLAEQAVVDGFVAVEAGRSAGENHFLEQMAGASAGILAFIPYADISSPDLGRQLDVWQKNPKFRGIRMGFEADADAAAIRDPDVIAGLKEIASREVVFEFLVQSGQLDDIARIYDQVPRLRSVIEHMAKPDVLERSGEAQWQQQMQRLGQIENLYCKLSFSPRGQDIAHYLNSPRQGRFEIREMIKPYVEFLLGNFDTQKLMWGSDWPISIIFQDYRAVREAFVSLLGADTAVAASIFCDNALRFYMITLEE